MSDNVPIKGQGTPQARSIPQPLATSILPAGGGDKFDMIRQGPVTNTFTTMKAIEGENTTIDTITGVVTVTKGDVIVSAKDFSIIAGLGISTHMLLDIITAKLTEGGARSPRVDFTLDEYMRKRGLRNRKGARAQVQKDLDTLLELKITYNKTVRGEIRLGHALIADSWDMAPYSKDISFTFGSTFYRILQDYPVMPYPKKLYTFTLNKNPNSYYFLRKISEHKRMNTGKDNEDIISVKTLLEATPYIPSYEKVKEGDRRYTGRIIEPFERDMDILEETLDWEYCHSKGRALTDRELEDWNYELFESLKVLIKWDNYPDQTARLIATEKRKKAQKKKAK